MTKAIYEIDGCPRTFIHCEDSGYFIKNLAGEERHVCEHDWRLQFELDTEAKSIRDGIPPSSFIIIPPELHDWMGVRFG